MNALFGRPRSVIALLALVIGCFCHGQTVMSIAEYRSIGKIADLDTLYQSSLHIDPTQAAFRGQEDEFIRHYSTFYNQLNDHLHANGFAWQDTARCFNKLYFRADGRMDRFLYSFRGAVSPEQQQRFQELTTSFLKDYRFPMTNSVPFRQCGPSTFVPRVTGKTNRTQAMNHFAILACAVSIFLLGGLWYSAKVFGTAWGKANGTLMEPKRMPGPKHPAYVYGVSFVMAWIAAYAFAALVGPQPTIHHALHHGLVCGAGIAATSFAINYQFANRSTVLLLIDAGYHIVQFVLYGLILGLWH